MRNALKRAGLMLVLVTLAAPIVAQNPAPSAARVAAEDEARIEALLHEDEPIAAADGADSGVATGSEAGGESGTDVTATAADLDPTADRATADVTTPTSADGSTAATDMAAATPTTAAERLRALTTKPGAAEPSVAASVDNQITESPDASTAAADAALKEPLDEDAPLERLPDPEEIAFADLKAHIGKPVRIMSIGGRTRVGRVESVDRTGVNLRVRTGGGYAQFKLPASQIASIRRVGGE